MYTLAGDELSEKKSFKVSGEIAAMAYSPNGEDLAVTAGRSIVILDSASYQVREGGREGECHSVGVRGLVSSLRPSLSILVRPCSGGCRHGGVWV